MTMTQGEAVFQAVSSTVGEFEGAVKLNDSQKKEVYAKVIAFFQTGACSHSNPTADLNKYVPGLVNNWVRKDPRLNGGGKYTAKRPGSRTGSGDESLKAMKALLSITTDEDAREAISAEIASRIESLKPKATINVAALPEALRHLVG